MHLSGNSWPSNGMHGTATANMQNTGDAMPISSVIPKPPQSNHPKKAKSKKKTKGTAPTSTSKAADTLKANANREKKEERKEKTRVGRATMLRKQYPNMQNIPNSITPSQRKKLIALHTQNATDTSTLQQTQSATNKGPKDAGQAPTTKLTATEKQRHRAASLKQRYPDMEGIPPKIGKGTGKKLIAQYKARSTAPAPAPSVTVPTSTGTAAKYSLQSNELPTRPVPPHSTSGTYATRQISRETLVGSSINSDSRSQRPTSYKMAPLSEERRAEVARNLAAGSNDDPVMID